LYDLSQKYKKEWFLQFYSKHGKSLAKDLA